MQYALEVITVFYIHLHIRKLIVLEIQAKHPINKFHVLFSI